ncbi:hypothetical protein NE683_09320 [Bariatricus massiliensis]|nr:hypothetical protein [Bariatricus massiliensis]MDY2663460.1 hypothetical protein [Bariatricus massiliensis]
MSKRFLPAQQVRSNAGGTADSRISVPEYDCIPGLFVVDEDKSRSIGIQGSNEKS